MNTSAGSNHLRAITRYVAGILITLFVATPLAAQSAETFLNRMQTKFRRTASIYMEAQSHRIGPDGTLGDTMDVTLAYRYPDQLLQWVRIPDNREQIIIYRGDTVVISYPHIDVTRKKAVSRRRLHRLIADQVPFAAVFVGLAEKALDPDSVTVTPSGEVLNVTFRGRRRGQSTRIEGQFTRDELRPREMTIHNDRGQFRVTINVYEEEKRFPKPVERALQTRRPDALRENKP
jgi:outer membrane lipoprotein-sorting protein